MAADILSQHSFFLAHPEMFKALIMTGSTLNIKSAYLDGDRDNYSRIRKIPLYSKMAWGTRSAYCNGPNNGCFDKDSLIIINESNIESGKNYRIAISWLSSGYYVQRTNLLPQDMDLFVYQDNVLLASSISPTNPFELVDFTTKNSHDLKVIIKRVRNSKTDNVFLGYNFLQVN